MEICGVFSSSTGFDGSGQYPRQELNNLTKALEKRMCGASLVQNPVHFGRIHPDLQLVIDAWPKLSDGVRADIVAMIRTASYGSEPSNMLSQNMG